MEYVKPFVWPFVVIYNWIKEHWKLIGAIAIAVALFICGWSTCKHYDQNVVVKTEIQTVEKEIPIEVPVLVKGDTEIRYVEKTSPDDSDVEITNPAPVIAVSYNGEKTELDGIQSEKQKFDKGKLQVEQSTEAVLDVTPIVERETQLAVDKQKLQDEAEKQEAIKDEKHKAHQHGQKTLLGGIGLGIIAGLLL